MFSYFSYSSTENEIFGNRFNFNIFKRITRSHLVVILEDVDGRKFPFTLDSELGYYTSEKCDEKIYKDDDYYYIHTMDNLIYRCKEEAMVDKITFPNGDEIEFYEYDAWGKLINPTTYINTILYKGYYYDVGMGYFWLSSRYYSPELCRFISPDDVEYLETQSINGLNLYCYCFNDPINYIDPDGHMALFLVALIAGGIAASANVFSQMVFEDKAFNEIVWSDVIISGVAGFAGGLIPGSSFLSLVGQSAMSALVENGLRSIWYGDEFSMGKVLKETITSVTIGTAAMGISYGVNKLTSKITNKLFIKAPNYSQYQHYYRGKGFNYTREEVYEQMYKNGRRMSWTNKIVDKTTGYFLDFAGELF